MDDARRLSRIFTTMIHHFRVMGDAEQAMAYGQQALADALGMRPLQAHCHRGLGMLYSKTGQWEQARAALLAAIDLYRTMEMLFWLPQASPCYTSPKNIKEVHWYIAVKIAPGWYEGNLQSLLEGRNNALAS